MFHDPLTSRLRRATARQAILSPWERKEKGIAGLAFRLSLRKRKRSAAAESAFVL
jgi:hypothetical protein